MKTPSIAIAAILLAGCATGPVVETERDPAVDLSRYRTFAWKQEPPIGSPLLRQRVVAEVEAQLEGKGWVEVPEDVAEVLLVGNVASRQDATLDTFYESGGWDSWNWYGRRAFGTQRIELRTYRIGTLVVDMFDARSRQAIWRGVAQGTVPDSEAHRTRDALEAVDEMFRGFPPADPAGR